MNQVGYLADSPVKIAYLGRWMGSFPEGKGGSTSGPALAPAAPPPFQVCREEDGSPVFAGRAKLVHQSGEMNEGYYKVDHSGENVYVLDFTALRRTRPILRLRAEGRSQPFLRDRQSRVSQGVRGPSVRCICPALRDRARAALFRVAENRLSSSRADHHHAKADRTARYRTSQETAQHVVEPGSLAIPRPGEVPMTLAAYGGHHDAGDYNPARISTCLKP